jgi:hypothetical protein
MIYIGIDPGKFTGVAAWYKNTKALELHTFSFWETIDYLTMQMEYSKKHNVQLKVVLEDPNQNKPIYFGNKRAVNEATRLRVAQNVGSNKRDAQLMEVFLERNGIEVTLVKPTTSKWSLSYFQKITKYTGRTSEHARDAAKLVYGL